MTYLMALDQGTTSSRTLIFTADGRLVAQAQREFTQHFPQPGQVEHDPGELWAGQLATVHDALAQAGLAADAIAALGITNQRETTLIWDRATGAPIHRALVWQDRRSEPICRRWRDAGHAARVRERTGLVIDPYFSASKIAWLLDDVPGARVRAERGELAFGTVDSWLCWQLTGGARHVTDVTNASRTMLFDIRRGVWDDDLLAAFGIPAALLPTVVPSAGVVATTRADLFGAAIPIAGLAGDQQAALAGQACFSPGLAKNTYGTGCFLLLSTGDRFIPSAHGLLTIAAARTGMAPAYALEGSVFVGGAVVQWLRDGLHIIARSEDVEALAASVPDAGGVTFVPAFTGLGAPHWQADARGALFGLTRGSTTAHIARAALEAIAFQSADLLAAMQADSGTALQELRVDGGASRNDALMQLQADLIGLPVVRPQVTETTAHGAALLAGLAVGVYTDTADLARHWRAERSFTPAMSRDEATARQARWAQAVRATLAAPA